MSDHQHVVTCLYCGPIAMADGLSGGSRAATEHTDQTGHMTMSRTITVTPEQKAKALRDAARNSSVTMRMTGPATLTDFLLARIAEDEAAGVDPYIWQFSSERWSAECEARRRIVAWAEGWQMDVRLELLRLLALPYADHPDYREEWRP